MKATSTHIRVELGEASHSIEIGERLEDVLGEVRQKGALVFTDSLIEGVFAGLMDRCFEGLPRFVMEPGEASKSMEGLQKAYDFLIEHGVKRDGHIYAMGGGVVGDLAGFAAATYMRGIGYTQVPTTLLGMVDSSMGGKTCINLPQGKNLVGAVYQPERVVIARELLESLPERQFASGMAEVIKYGLIFDPELLDVLEKQGRGLRKDKGALIEIIQRCCRHKVGVIERDAKEDLSKVERAVLNFGHTFGHAIETVTQYAAYTHGEAIGLGFLMALDLSIAQGRKLEGLKAQTVRLLEEFGLKTRLDTPLDVEALMEAICRDKKQIEGQMRFITLKEAGQADMLVNPDRQTVESIWRNYMP